MAVKSSVFGNVVLSKEDAEKFVSQVKYGRPKQSAKDAYARGRNLLRDFERNGSAKITRSK